MVRDILSYAGMMARLTRDLPAFLRNPITAEQAAAIVRRRLETRPERFLQLAELMIYRHPRSPYLWLLRAAGCELGDLRALVAHEGLDGALMELADRGVYVSFDEFKGPREIVRGSQRFTPAEQDFDAPGLARHLETRSGGTRSSGTVVKLSLSFLSDQAPGVAIVLQAHNLLEADHATWMTAPFTRLLRYSMVGRPLVAWFHPLKPLPWQVRAAGLYLRVLCRLLGSAFPEPTWIDLQDPVRLAGWLADRAARGRPVCVTTFASSAVRVALAAQARRLTLDNVCFVITGEPFTDGKQQALQAVGARALPYYGLAEMGTLGYQCAQPRSSDDLHFFSDSYAVIQRPRVLGDYGLSVDAFLFSTLLPSAPKVMLNVENGDHGVRQVRDCGCALGATGLNDHFSEIRSHEKLTGEGMTFVKTRLLSVLEDVLPNRFGGSTADYQVLEEEDSQGILRLYLLVHPRLGEVSQAQLKQVFLQEIQQGSELESYMASIWERAGTIAVRREPPRVTKAGKILPFHLDNPTM